MELKLAIDLVNAVFAEARRRDALPLSVIVLDTGGHQVAGAREDGAGFARLEMARGKAWGSLGLGFGSRTLSERVGKAPEFFAAAASLLEGRLLPAPGGLLVVRDGETIGAIGVSGDTGDTDEACAIAAIEACGLAYKN
jgi:uncharacterized protein GlcG (DUF336 family)